jgi:RNA ligase (TIGR02306 family)
MKLATIEKVIDKTPIPNADKIELMTVLGWQVIAKKDQYVVGDYCIYIPIDTTIDPTREYFKFLADKKDPQRRVKISTIKMKGVFSQGLVIPITTLDLSFTDIIEGKDVSDLLDIQKYEKENILKMNRGLPVAPFPIDIISKTDEDNLRTYPNVLKEFIGEDVYLTLKMDGSSMTIIYKVDEPMLVCSRNLILNKESTMYEYAALNIKNALEKYGKNIAIQGEFCGPKINGNRLELYNYEYYIFNIKDLHTNAYLDYDNMCKVATELGCKTVPLLHTFKFTEEHTIPKLQILANEVVYTTPKKKIIPGEGIVIRPLYPKWSEELSKFLSVKIINQLYKD